MVMLNRRPTAILFIFHLQLHNLKIKMVLQLDHLDGICGAINKSLIGQRVVVQSSRGF